MKRKGGRGFTLIEMLLVLALLALLFASLMPKATSLFRVNVQSSVRRFAALVRFAYDQSVLTGKLHRIVLDFDKQTWAVEAANPGELPIDEAKRELNPYFKNRDLKEGEADPDEPGFQAAGRGLVSQLPRGVAIVEAHSWRYGDKSVSKGVFSIFAYPSGMIDEARVRFAEEGKEKVRTYEVSIQPLTGRTKIEVSSP